MLQRYASRRQRSTLRIGNALLLVTLFATAAPVPDPSFLPAAFRVPHCCVPDQIASADLNRDGRDDLVLPSGYQRELAVRLALPGGGFDEPRAYPLPDIQLLRAAAAVGDATADGYVDIIVAVDAATILVFPNDGAGNFGTAQRLSSAPGGIYPYAVAFADVDGDGNGDIVTANNDTDDVSILRGNGRGAFDAAIVIPAGDSPTAIAVADLTGDGKTDILTANAAGQDVTLLVGNGAGRFAAPIVVRIGANSIPLAIKVADVTGDGRPDILTANQQSDGTEIPTPELAGSISVVRNDGNGDFAEALQYKVPDGYGRIAGVAVGDITGDGRADLVGTLPIKSRVVMFPANQGGQFAEPFYRAGGGGPNAVTLIDATDDGNLDIITANFESATLSILPSDGAGHIGYDNNFDVGENPHAVVATDLDKDGRTDLATADAFSLTVLMQAANGGFAPPVFHPAPGFPGKIAAGDLNRDGNQDLVVANMSFGEIAVLLGDGTGDFAPALRHPVSDTLRGPYTLALGDVNHDGNLDVVTANSAFLDHDDSLSLLLGNGAGSFAAPKILRLTGNATRYDPKDVVLADIHNDGHLDIVTANFAAQTVSIFAGDGRGRFSRPAHLPTQAGPMAVRIADVSGDGVADLIVLNHTEQTVSVSNGTGRARGGGPNSLERLFAPARHYAVYDSYESIWLQPWPIDLLVHDVTRDGHADIVTANTIGDSISVLPNDGTGGFGPYFVYGTGAGPSAIAAAHMDGDLLVDIVTANLTTHNVSVLLNRSAVAHSASAKSR